MSIVDKIKELCSLKGTNITSLERELGFGKGTIRNWENSSPNSQAISKIADYFHVTTDYLLGRDGINSNLKARTIAAHLEDKNITDQKMELIMSYLNALFDEKEKEIKSKNS